MNLRSIGKRAASILANGGSMWLFILPVLLLSASGCGSHIRVFLHPEADTGFYTKVGVAPFRSLTGDRFAGEKFSIEFTTALLASELFEVVDYGIFANALVKAVGSKSPAQGFALDDLKKIKESIGVLGVFTGTVKQYGMVSSGGGSFPVISVEVRLLDCDTGNVVWMATATRKGGPKAPIIGIGEIHTLGELSQKMCRELVSKLE